MCELAARLWKSGKYVVRTATTLSRDLGWDLWCDGARLACHDACAGGVGDPVRKATFRTRCTDWPPAAGLGLRYSKIVLMSPRWRASTRPPLRARSIAWHSTPSCSSLRVRGFVRELLKYVGAPMFDVPGALLWGLPTLCWWIGGASLLHRRSDATYALLALLSLYIIFSAPVIGRDGGARIFAAGFPVMAVQTALGVNALFMLFRKLCGSLPSAAPVDPKPGAFEYALVGVLALLLLIPLTPIRQILERPEASAQPCAVGLRSVIVRPGYETHFLSIVPGARPLDALRPEKIERRLFPGSWINESITALQTPPGH
jgi:hypothetical protein